MCSLLSSSSSFFCLQSIYLHPSTRYAFPLKKKEACLCFLYPRLCLSRQPQRNGEEKGDDEEYSEMVGILVDTAKEKNHRSFEEPRSLHLEDIYTPSLMQGENHLSN